ncbi:hypothetical protein B0A49_03592 [Cryomyces minteri]|uniref:tRNA (adenine(58)-N(1))-methyltransferase non-catalytic subunit TRM6 n=1 Tax=Cryomyces minteri TaxID=331657 RepID=A0A4U0XJ90_9PEZI|nr:hypothetical protein B0A49_03592 [Cryomyces minteri]
MHSYISPNTYITLRLPSGTLRVLRILPNTTISIGKFGSFPANLLLGRPYHLTYEILEADDDRAQTELRIVPAAEIHAEALAEDATATESRADPLIDHIDGDASPMVAENGDVLGKSNRLTVDNAARQTLSYGEIEQLKKAKTGTGKEIIAKIMEAHANLDEKTAFSLAKYTLRKAKKFWRRFTVLPLDVSMLTQYMLSDKESSKVMDLREEMLGLIGCWANVHYGVSNEVRTTDDGLGQIGGGRWLMIDDTGGLLVAAMAEKMGILYPEEEDEGQESETVQETEDGQLRPDGILDTPVINSDGTRFDEAEAPPNPNTAEDQPMPDAMGNVPSNSVPAAKTTTARPTDATSSSPAIVPTRKSQQLALNNTLTVLHANAQPNLALLKYFSYDTSNPANASSSHPLHTHLRTLSWLQLLHPSEDPTYLEPERFTPQQMQGWKSGKKTTYYKKRRRWERARQTVDQTRAGGFDGLIVASAMAPATILQHTIPLLRGGAQVVVYSPTIEPLTELADLYSRDRRAAFLLLQQQQRQQSQQPDSDPPPQSVATATHVPAPDFPLNPTLLLAPSLQTARARAYQVLPGRTHPLMTSRGGAEGYVFSATRVLPAEGNVQARGKFAKKRRRVEEGEGEGEAAASGVV